MTAREACDEALVELPPRRGRLLVRHGFIGAAADVNELLEWAPLRAAAHHQPRPAAVDVHDFGDGASVRIAATAACCCNGDQHAHGAVGQQAALLLPREEQRASRMEAWQDGEGGEHSHVSEKAPVLLPAGQRGEGAVRRDVAPASAAAGAHQAAGVAVDAPNAES